VVRDQDHGALLDRRRDSLRARLRPLLPVLPPLPAVTPPDLPRRALVLGLARSGHAAAIALRGHGVEVVGHDRSRTIEIARLVDAGVTVHLGEEKEKRSLLRAIDVVVKSPGIPGTAPLPTAARRRGIPVWSEIEVGARLLRNPLLGIT